MCDNNYKKLLGLLYIVTVLLFVNNAWSQPSGTDLCEGEQGVSYSLCKSYYKSLDRYKMKTSNLPPPGKACEDICPCNFSLINPVCWAGMEDNPVEFVSGCDITWDRAIGDTFSYRIYREVYLQYRVVPDDPSQGSIFAIIGTYCLRDEDGNCVQWYCSGDAGSQSFPIECNEPEGGGFNSALNPSELMACNCELEKYAKELYYGGVPIIGIEGPTGLEEPVVLPRIKYQDELPDEAFTCQ